MMPPTSVFFAASASWYTGLVSPMARANSRMWPASTGNVIFANGFLRCLFDCGKPSPMHCSHTTAHGIMHAMVRPVRRPTRPRIRAELDATAVPTWRPPRIATADAKQLHFVLSPGRLPRGRRIYAIGDIHGCLAELGTLHAAIAEDLARRPAASGLLLHLG